MKGIVLAGGLGTRLLPLTKITNKHLLPVYKEPMIYYPIKTLINAGISDIMIVTGGNHAGEFLRLLGDGKQFGLKHISYTYQEGEGGIAEALGLTEDFADGDKIVVVLGDNIIENNIVKQKEAFERQKEGAKIIIKKSLILNILAFQRSLETRLCILKKSQKNLSQSTPLLVSICMIIGSSMSSKRSNALNGVNSKLPM